MKIAPVEKRHIIDRNKLSYENYFTSLMKEAHASGLLYDSDIENIQLQCLQFLAYKCERHNGGDSSSIRVEVAESIMKSNIYTIGLYLKSLSDADCAAAELKSSAIPEMYQKGREIIGDKLQAAKNTYKLAQKNKLNTINYTYNATLSDDGIGTFFKAYDPDYEAHEIPAFIDYQLCNPVTDLAGVEFIQKYTENLLWENEFCSNFAAGDIHYLLRCYDEGYQELLINIFEQVLTAALCCLFAGRSVLKLAVPREEMQLLYNELLKHDHQSLALTVCRGIGKLLEELNITGPSLRIYIEQSLPKITTNIAHAVRTGNLDKLLAVADKDLKPKIKFSSGVKMDDKDYRKLIAELLICRYSSDKLALIKERVKSFDDLEDVLFDAELNEEEMNSVFSILEDVEMAALVKRHPFKQDIEAVYLSEAGQTLRSYLKSYINQLPPGRREQVFEIMDRLIDEDREILG